MFLWSVSDHAAVFPCFSFEVPSTVSASHKWPCPRLGDGCGCKGQHEAVEFRKWMRLLIFTNGVTGEGWWGSPAVGLKDRDQESEVYFQVLPRVSG